MSIWLAMYKEGSSGGGGGGSSIDSMLPEIDAIDEEIATKAKELRDKLIEWSQKEKETEKEEIISAHDLSGVSKDNSWQAIVAAYQDTYPDSDTPSDLNAILANGMDESGFGRVAWTNDKNFSEAYQQNSGDFDTIVTKLGELRDKMDELLAEVESERSDEGKGYAPKDDGMTASVSDIAAEVQGLESIRIDSVTNLSVEDERWLVEHRVPGRSGEDSAVSASVIQDLGRKPVRITFMGSFIPQDDRNLDTNSILRRVELLKWFFKARKPLFFASQLINRADMTKVVIDNLRFKETAEFKRRVMFECTLREYNELDWTKEDTSADDKIQQMNEHWIQYQTRDALYDYRQYAETPKNNLMSLLLAGALR